MQFELFSENLLAQDKKYTQISIRLPNSWDRLQWEFIEWEFTFNEYKGDKLEYTNGWSERWIWIEWHIYVLQ